MDYKKLIERIFDHLENDNVEKAVMSCLRLARNLNDYLYAANFMRELYPDKKAVARVLYDDTSHLNRDAQKFVWDKSLDHWLSLHTLDFSMGDDAHLPEGDQKRLLKVAISEIDQEIDQWERTIIDVAIPVGMGEYDTVAFTDRFIEQKQTYRLRIKALQTIRGRVKANCLNYAIQLERQLGAQKKNQSFLLSVQNEVNNFFKSRSDDVFCKLQKAAQLSTSSDTEDAALLLTEVRRTLKAAADYFYPPVSELVMCLDGKERKLDDDQYLNRLSEYVAINVPRSTSKELLKTELDCLISFIKSLNKISSKGVHATATFAESRQGLVGLYFFLYNLCQRITESDNECI